MIPMAFSAKIIKVKFPFAPYPNIFNASGLTVSYTTSLKKLKECVNLE